MKNKKLISLIVALVVIAISALGGLFAGDKDDTNGTTEPNTSTNQTVESLNEIPEFSGTAYVVINDNQPYFTEEDYTTESYEYYSPLDELGRCGVTMACIGEDIMPTDERGEIGQVKPTGWVTAKYDFVDGKYLYNRCHLIGWQLTGENANEQNLITGTRYMNVDGMLPFENMVDDYIEETGNHVLYRVTPIFKDDELVARGVTMEAWSVEDNGEGICFNVYCYNNQPGVEIDYATGKSWESDTETTSTTSSTASSTSDTEYVLNTKSKKIHLPDCSSVGKIEEDNKEVTDKSKEELINEGYEACGSCKP